MATYLCAKKNNSIKKYECYDSASGSYIKVKNKKLPLTTQTSTDRSGLHIKRNNVTYIPCKNTTVSTSRSTSRSTQYITGTRTYTSSITATYSIDKYQTRSYVGKSSSSRKYTISYVIYANNYTYSNKTYYANGGGGSVRLAIPAYYSSSGSSFSFSTRAKITNESLLTCDATIGNYYGPGYGQYGLVGSITQSAGSRTYYTVNFPGITQLLTSTYSKYTYGASTSVSTTTSTSTSSTTAA